MPTLNLPPGLRGFEAVVSSLGAKREMLNKKNYVQHRPVYLSSALMMEEREMNIEGEE